MKNSTDKNSILAEDNNDINNINNNTISFIFTGSENKTITDLIQYKIDIEAISSIGFNQFNESLKSQLKIIDKTMTILTDIVSHRDQLDQTIVDKIKNILITMNKDSKGVNILRNFDNETKFEEMKNIKQVLNKFVQMVS